MRSHITGNQMRLPDGDIDDFFPVELQFQRFQSTAGGLDRFDPFVAAKSVIQVDGKVSDFNIRHVLKLRA